MSQWFTGAVDLIGDWRSPSENARRDLVSLADQEDGTLSAHPLPMKLSIATVGWYRVKEFPTPVAKFTLIEFVFKPPLDFFALPDGSVLGDEAYSDPLGIG